MASVNTILSPFELSVHRLLMCVCVLPYHVCHSWLPLSDQSAKCSAFY